MPRKAKWVPRIVNHQDLREVETLEENFLPHDLTASRVRRDFTIFLSINALTAVEGFRLFVGQLLASGLQPGTVETYARHVYPLVKHLSQSVEDKLKARNTMNAVTRKHAASETSHAPDQDASTIERYLEVLPLKIEAELVKVLLAGIRVANSKHNKVTINRSQGLATLESRLRKNGKRRSDRRSITIPYGEIIGYTPSRQVTRFLNHKDKQTNSNVTTAEVNLALAKARDQHHLPHATTYTFRRFFLKKVVEFCGGDTKAASYYSLHKNHHIIDAHYLD